MTFAFSHLKGQFTPESKIQYVLMYLICNTIYPSRLVLVCASSYLKMTEWVKTTSIFPKWTDCCGARRRLFLWRKEVNFLCQVLVNFLQRSNRKRPHWKPPKQLCCCWLQPLRTSLVPIYRASLTWWNGMSAQSPKDTHAIFSITSAGPALLRLTHLSQSLQYYRRITANKVAPLIKSMFSFLWLVHK